jgi:hypothetical protein
MHAEYQKSADSKGAFDFALLALRFWLCAFGSSMSEPREDRYDSIARRWLALIELRQAHVLELCDTGRWRHYYTEAEFVDEMQKVLHLRGQWAAIAGLPLQSEDVSAEDSEREPPRPRQLSAAVPDAQWPG